MSALPSNGQVLPKNRNALVELLTGLENILREAKNRKILSYQDLEKAKRVDNTAHRDLEVARSDVNAVRKALRESLESVE